MSVPGEQTTLKLKASPSQESIGTPEDSDQLRQKVKFMEASLHRLQDENKRLRRACMVLQYRQSAHEKQHPQQPTPSSDRASSLSDSTSSFHRLSSTASSCDERAESPLPPHGSNHRGSEEDVTVLHQQLEQVKKEKVEIENELEQESEHIVNRLAKTIERLEMEKRNLEERLKSPNLQASHVARELSEEVFRLRHLLSMKGLSASEENLLEQVKLKEENQKLHRKLQIAQERIAVLEKEKALYEAEVEVDEERSFNVRRSMSPNPSPRSTPSSPSLYPNNRSSEWRIPPQHNLPLLEHLNRQRSGSYGSSHLSHPIPLPHGVSPPSSSRSNSESGSRDRKDSNRESSSLLSLTPSPARPIISHSPARSRDRELLVSKSLDESMTHQ